MNQDLMQIPARIRELREILEISSLEIAEKIGVPYESYLKYENGELDIPISTLYEIAAVLGTDMTVLLTGENPRMGNVSVVRGGDGIKVERFEGYEFIDLAYNFKDRNMEPMIVTLDPAKEPAKLVMHKGQEFNYILEGTVEVTVGRKSYVLKAGDSIYFNPRLPHGQVAVGETSKFLTVIQD